MKRKIIIILFGLLTELSPLGANYAAAQTLSPLPIPASTSGQTLPTEFDPNSNTSNNTPTPNFSDANGNDAQFRVRGSAYVRALSKSSYQAKEDVVIVVKNSTGENLEAVLDGGDSSPLVSKEVVNGDTVFTITPTSNIKPGKYTVKVLDTNSNQIVSQQDFTWGVLAINTNKSIYLPQENANIAIAVLDENGNMECHAEVNLKITSPLGNVTNLSTKDGTINVNQECWLHRYTTRPDYQTNYQTNEIGRYVMDLSASSQKGSYTTSDRFEVRQSVPFDVERVSATRIYPPEKYPVELKIKANQAFRGKIVEPVPAGFQISQLEKDGVYGYSQENTTSTTNVNTGEYGIPKLHLPFSGNYSVSEGFGQQLYDSQEISVYRISGLDGHDGIDFAMPDGSPILSSDDGTVILAQAGWIYGTSIVIQHKWGRSYYGHLSKLEVAVGDHVKSGQEIALSGHTGLATGPHLHFGVKPNNSDIFNLYFGKVDPSPYLGISSEDPVLSDSNYPVSSKVLVWNVDVAKGAEFTIGYQFLAPPKSPDFYTLGPLQFISSKINSQPQAKFDVPASFVVGASTTSGVLIPNPSTSSGSADKASANQNQTSDQVVFQEIRQWQLAIDAATTIIIDSTYTDSCGSNCFTVPSNWNAANNSIETLGAGGNGAAGTTALAGGGGGGGAYSNRTNQNISSVVNFHLGTGGSGPGTAGDTWFCNSTSNCTSIAGTAVISGAKAGSNASGITAGAGGSTTGAIGDTGAKFTGGTGGAGVNSARMSAGGGGGAGGPNGNGHTGGNGRSAATGGGGGGGGGDGGASGSDGAQATSATGGDGGNGYGGSGSSAGGTGGSGGGNGGTGTNGGGGGGGSGINGTGTAGAGGTGSQGTDFNSGNTVGSCGGAGGGGGNARTAGGTKNGGDGGSPPANCGGGGGGGGSANTNGGALGSGSGGLIIVTYTPVGPTLDQLMRHGNWFSSGAEQSFTF